MMTVSSSDFIPTDEMISMAEGWRGSDGVIRRSVAGIHLCAHFGLSEDQASAVLDAAEGGEVHDDAS